MPLKFFSGSERHWHLLAGLGAIGLSLLFTKNRILRYLFGGIAAAELIYSLAPRRRTIDEKETPVSESLRSAVVEGIEMRWEEYGTAQHPPVVLIHGIPTGPRLWRYVIPRLAFSGARCFAWEMVGYGSSWPESFRRDISIRKQVDYLYAWLKHLNIEKAVLVGHDIGGGVAQRFAIEHRGHCMGLVLVDAVAYDNWPVPTMKLAQANAALIKYMPPFLVKPFFISRLLRIGHDNYMRGLESLELHWRHYAHARGPQAFVRQIKGLDNRHTLDIAGKLPEINVTARVVWGERDPLKKESGERLANDLKVDFKVIPGAKHYTPEDRPDMVAAAIKELLVEIEEKTSLNQ